MLARTWLSHLKISYIHAAVRRPAEVHIFIYLFREKAFNVNRDFWNAGIWNILAISVKVFANQREVLVDSRHIGSE